MKWKTYLLFPWLYLIIDLKIFDLINKICFKIEKFNQNKSQLFSRFLTLFRAERWLTILSAAFKCKQFLKRGRYYVFFIFFKTNVRDKIYRFGKRIFILKLLELAVMSEIPWKVLKITQMTWFSLRRIEMIDEKLQKKIRWCSEIHRSIVSLENIVTLHAWDREFNPEAIIKVNFFLKIFIF